MTSLRQCIVLVPTQVLFSRIKPNHGKLETDSKKSVDLVQQITQKFAKINIDRIEPKIDYISINTSLIMEKYLFPDDQKKFTYRGADKKIIGRQYTREGIKRLLDDNKNSSEFYHYLPFNFVTRKRKTIDAIDWNEKINKEGFILKAGIKFYDDQPNNYIEVESYYSGRFNPPKGSVGRETLWDGAKREILEELKVIVIGRCPRKNSTVLINIYNQKYNKNFKFRAIFMGYEIITRKKN